MDLFTPIVEEQKQNMIFKTLSHPNLYAEREVLDKWATGFTDRDNKFVQEFQSTFESSFWELYLNAVLNGNNVNVDYSYYAPDFVCEKNGLKFCIEATIANPEQDGLPAYGFDNAHQNFDIDFKEFNRKSIIRIANSIVSKNKKFDKSYKNHSHVIGKPFILGLNSFDRPHAHFIGHRGIIAVLYGIYLNEEKALSQNLNYIPKDKMDFITKENGAEIPLGFFTTPEYENISAVIYNPLATWGKVRALAQINDFNKGCFFTTLHTNEDPDSMIPETNMGIKKEIYMESLIDGTYIFYNPFAKYPLDYELFDQKGIAHITINEAGNLEEFIPGRFLLSRTLISTDGNTLPKK